MSQRVLIVEDDNILREMYALKLTMDGFTVDTARDGIEGLEKVAAAKPDLIILDMLMPRLDGLQFLARYNQRPPDQRATVLVASNKSSTEQINKAKQLGAAEYLIKSKLTPDDLVVHVRKYLEPLQPA